MHCFRRHRAAPVVPLLIAAVAVFALAPPLRAADSLDAARARETLLADLTVDYERGDTERVITVLGDSLPAAEFTPRLRNLQGLALAAEGRHQEAVVAYEAGIRGGGNPLFELHVNLAISLQALGVAGRAMAEFQRAVEVAPHELEARVALGKGYIDYRRYHLAREQLEEAARIDPDDVRVIRQQARLADETGEPEESRAQWARLEGIAPDADTARRLAELSVDADPEAAIRWYGVCVERDPAAGDCASAGGALLLGEGRGEEALPWLRQAEAAGATSPQLVHNLLLACQLTGATDSLEAVLARHEVARADSWGVVALARREGGDQEAALEAAQEAHRLAPENPDLANILAVLLHESGRTEEARGLWRTILETYPEHPQARANLDEARS